VPARRVTSFFVLVLLLVAATLYSRGGPGAILCFFTIILFTVAGTMEFYGLAERKGGYPDRHLGTACAVIFISVIFFKCFFSTFSPGRFIVPGYIEILTFLLIVIGIFSSQMFKVNGESPLLSSSTTLSGVIYVSWLFSFVVEIMYFPGVDGRWYVLFLFLVTKGSDTCAYLVGKAFGKNKLIPRISPAKTREGLIGGLAGAVAGGFIALYWFGCYCDMPSVLHVLVLSVVLGLVAIPGDLFESILKRDAGVKDVAGYLPGLGGVLDVIDSVLFTAPILYIYLVIFRG